MTGTTSQQQQHDCKGLLGNDYDGDAKDGGDGDADNDDDNNDLQNDEEILPAPRAEWLIVELNCDRWLFPVDQCNIFQGEKENKKLEKKNSTNDDGSGKSCFPTKKTFLCCKVKMAVKYD